MLLVIQSLGGMGSSRSPHDKVHGVTASCIMMFLMMGHAEPPIGAQAVVATVLHGHYGVMCLWGNWGPTEGSHKEFCSCSFI